MSCLFSYWSEPSPPWDGLSGCRDLPPPASCIRAASSNPPPWLLGARWGIPTVFVATFNSGKLVIEAMGEYDALLVYS